VTYLCYAFDIPYASFKRWKNEAFVDKKYLPEHKGKSVLTDKVWAAQMYNPRRMFITHSFNAWIERHPSKKNDANAKKVRPDVVVLQYTIACIHDILFRMLKVKKTESKGEMDIPDG
jgi:hypothetical protein